VLVPQGGEGDLLRAVDADGIAGVDQVAGELLGSLVISVLLKYNINN